MPSSSLYVGPQLLPAETAGANSALRDPTIDGLLEFFAHWIRETCSDKIVEMQGPVSSAAVEDACPVTHLFPWNHNGTFMRKHACSDDPATPREPLPGLWIWEESVERSRTHDTLWYKAHERTLRLNWIFPMVQIPGGYAARSGLTAAVGRAILAACDHQRHPTFELNGSAPGAKVISAIGPNILGFYFERGAHGSMAPSPGSSVANNGGRAASEGAVQRFYPAFDATIKVVERVGEFESEYPDDVNQDGSLVISVGDNVADTVDVLERILIAPDDTA